MTRFSKYSLLLLSALCLTHCARPIANPPGYTLSVAPPPAYVTKAPSVGAKTKRVFAALKQGGVQIRKQDKAIDLLMPAGANFKPASSVTNPTLMALLDDVAEYMIGHAYTFATVHGHTDNTGGVQVNQALSERRAHAVIAYLESQGIPGNRLRIVGHGHTMPIASNAVQQGKHANRRVEIALTKN